MPLKRSLTLLLVTFYGLGTIIGAGIYALIGAVAQDAKEFTPFAFLIAGFMAFITGASYAELSSRFPQSAGSALYVKKAFNNGWISGLVGWLVIITGLVSAGTLAHGFANYLKLFVPISDYLSIFILISLLGMIAIWGITESAVTILLMTLLEIFGLMLVIWYGKDNFSKLFTQSNQFIPSHFAAWSGILSGAFIAFYAFIGFEDMVNVAEETKQPEKTLPRAIFLALTGATFLYLLISFVTVASLPYQVLATSDVPLTLIIKAQGHSALLFGIIAMVAIMNGILVQIIMSSRLLYGMANQNNAPSIFRFIYSRTQVPLVGIISIMVAIIILAYWFPIDTLAKATSTIILCVFSFMHLSLIVIKFKYPPSEFSIPILVPIIGILLSAFFLLFQILN